MPTFIEFTGTKDDDKSWLSKEVEYWLSRESGMKIEKAFPMDEKSLTLKVTFDDEA